MIESWEHLRKKKGGGGGEGRAREENMANFNFSMHSKHNTFHDHCKNIMPKVAALQIKI